MTPITRQDILAHQSVEPWAAQYQVEQDLLLCRAMVALFDDHFLSSQIAMRGGTLLHKVHLAPAARYSEDIDLVVVGTRPAEHIRRAIPPVQRSECAPSSCGASAASAANPDAALHRVPIVELVVLNRIQERIVEELSVVFVAMGVFHALGLAPRSAFYGFQRARAEPRVSGVCWQKALNG